jgi:hypothetical protein
MRKPVRWVVSGESGRKIEITVERTWCDRLVHYVRGWHVVDMETKGGVDPAHNVGYAGNASYTYEETLCGVAYPPNDKPPRAQEPVDCIACLTYAIAGGFRDVTP